MRVAFCTPTIERPADAYLKALEASVPLLDAAGIEHAAINEIGSPYISCARAGMLRKAMLWGADTFMFIDHDLSWEPQDLVTILQTPGEVVAGTYRYKIAGPEKYMGEHATDANGKPIVRPDGKAILAVTIPAGFLKVTREAVERFMAAYPELTIWRDNDGFRSPDLFNHGERNGTWWGEDYAFCRNWQDLGGQVWLVPNLNLTHHSLRGFKRPKWLRWSGLGQFVPERAWPGNYHLHLQRLPGGRLAA